MDASVIIAGFIVDVCLKGVFEEVGSILVVLRFWRVFKIIEEFSAGASAEMEMLNGRIELLETENRQLRMELNQVKAGSRTQHES